QDNVENAAEKEEEQRPVAPRRQRRQLTQKIRVTDNEQIAAPVETAPEIASEPVAALPAPTAPMSPIEGEVQTEERQESVAQVDGEEKQDTIIPRRSRRSPRHLRVSGQRRRRYRDERHLTKSPMPLIAAVASP
ncbi:ribonuclease E, partial [Escherichia coli]|nr:ribonuclease E [Escherichia coli]